MELFCLEDSSPSNLSWEYPGTQGIGCNAISVNDTANFLLFLQELREDPIGKNLVLTAPTSINPWVDSTGAASTNVSGFSQVFDFITIMNYDIWGVKSHIIILLFQLALTSGLYFVALECDSGTQCSSL